MPFQISLVTFYSGTFVNTIYFLAHFNLQKKVELILEQKALRSVFFFDKCIAISRSIWICGKTANLEEFRRSKTCRSWSGDCQHVTFVKTDHLRTLLCDWDKVKPSKSFQLKCKEQNSGEWRQRSIKS